MNSDQSKNDISAIDAKSQAQFIAFAPIMFQATRILKTSGLLETIFRSKKITLNQLCHRSHLSQYAISVLVEAGITSGVLERTQEEICLTKVGYFVLNDEMTQINMDFVHDVCYQGIFFLDKALEAGKPEGLGQFGPWKTIYEGLSKLPDQVLKSWLSFDHYYSDQAMDESLPWLFKNEPKQLLDVGGNTGRFSLKCLRYHPDVHVTVVDLPGQLKMLTQQLASEPADITSRLSLKSLNLLEPEDSLPSGFDAVWMSQFLDCFSPDQILEILRQTRDVLNLDGRLFILETYTDEQIYDAAAHSVSMSSLYFSAMANGNSKMYRFDEMKSLIEASGLTISEKVTRLGAAHTLLICEPTMYV